MKNGKNQIYPKTGIYGAVFGFGPAAAHGIPYVWERDAVFAHAFTGITVWFFVWMALGGCVRFYHAAAFLFADPNAAPVPNSPGYDAGIVYLWRFNGSFLSKAAAECLYFPAALHVGWKAG